MIEKLLDKLLLLPLENEVVEFKEAKNRLEKDKLGQYFSALANEGSLSHPVWALINSVAK